MLQLPHITTNGGCHSYRVKLMGEAHVFNLKFPYTNKDVCTSISAKIKFGRTCKCLRNSLGHVAN